MPTTVISIVKVDDLGQVWFFVPRPSQALHEFDREFPVKLEFFRKGRQFFLHITGKAFIVNDPEEVNSLVHEDLRESTKDHLVLIKVKMGRVDYFESQPRDHAKWWHELRKEVVSWVSNARPGYKPFHLDNPIPAVA